MTKKLSLLAGIALAAFSLGTAEVANAQQTTTTTYNRTTSTNTYAAPVEARTSNPYTPSTGPYVGVTGGYNWGEGIEGGEFGVFAGVEVGRMIDRHLNWGMFGALEAHYIWSESDGSVGGVGIGKDNEWGISFRPGFDFIADSAPLGLKPYAILGYRRAEFEGGGVSTDFDGFELGLGTQLMAWGQVGLRLDYTHVFYEEKGGLDPDEDNLRLGLSYHF